MKFDREEIAQKADEFVSGVFRSADLQLETKVEVVEEGVKIDVSGPDSGLVLTDNARLLYAVNHLVNQIFYRQSRDGCNFFLDCNNYRNERTLELELMAEKAAERARLTGRSVALQAMPSSERRTIHLKLADEQGVRTLSEGSGRYRKVLIIPALT
jgi:spoIIIJ-associated protein